MVGMKWIVAVALSVTLALPLSAKEGQLCQRVIETTFVKGPLIKGCKHGDTLVVQISPNIAHGAIVGRYCDLKYSIYSETHRKNRQVTVVCVFHGERKKRASP